MSPTIGPGLQGNARTLTFGSGAAAFNIKGADANSGLQIGASTTGAVINNSSSGQVISVGNINFNGVQTWNAASGDLTFSGSLIANTGFPLTVDGAFNVSIANSILGGGALTKNGAGTLLLTGTDAYEGGTTLALGTLKLGSPDALPNASKGGQVNFSGGRLQLNNQTTPTLGALSLQANSSILLSPDGVGSSITFSSATRSAGVLSIFGWTGATASGNDRIFVNGAVDATFLQNVQFYSDMAGTFPIGSGASLVGTQLQPVPEPVNLALGLFAAGWISVPLVRRFLSKKRDAA